MEEMLERVCEQCGVTFTRSVSQIRWYGSHFCSKPCQYEAQRVKVPRICERCGAAFTSGKGRFCSRECRGASRQKGVSRVCDLRICDQCGAIFARRSHHADGVKCFCSKGCMGLSMRGERIERICEHCGALFTFHPSPSDAHDRRFCSRKCWDKAQQNQVQRICEYCGVDFITKVSEVESGKGKFCSQVCGYHARRRAVSRVCITCGTVFTEPPSVIAAGGGKFCSATCRNKYCVGENAPNWAGGKSFEPYPPTFNRRFKRMIRERDGYSCVLCGKSNSKVVHHINYVKLDTHPENCVTLCISCHGKTNHNRAHWQAYFEAYMQQRMASAA